MNIDENRSSITFTSDAPGERIVGTTSSISGSLSVNMDDFAATTGELRFPVESLSTGNRTRDRHLAGRDWLNARENADVVFAVTSLENVRTSADGDRTDIEAVAVGEVEVNGVRAPVRAEVSIALLTEGKSARIQPRFTIRLADHNVTGARGVIGDKVGETIDIEGTIYAGWE